MLFLADCRRADYTCLSCGSYSVSGMMQEIIKNGHANPRLVRLVADNDRRYLSQHTSDLQALHAGRRIGGRRQLDERTAHPNRRATERFAPAFPTRGPRPNGNRNSPWQG